MVPISRYLVYYEPSKNKGKKFLKVLKILFGLFIKLLSSFAILAIIFLLAVDGINSPKHFVSISDFLLLGLIVIVPYIILLGFYYRFLSLMEMSAISLFLPGVSLPVSLFMMSVFSYVLFLFFLFLYFVEIGSIMLLRYWRIKRQKRLFLQKCSY